ncbi:MAG: glycosyltransferase family 2 protein [Verrucomicrobia bacterium]|nr:glycosyltransferase family 2 protein [Verrucomicrobiota bacterium]
MKTPVAFLIYRRPELTRRVFAEIRRARPERLLVVADGPRDAPDRPLCAAARAVIDGVDWPCRVQTEFASGNMGCRRRVATGLDWVFAQVEEAIILEDDTVPHPDFFPFCEELLARYRDDPRIGHIGGTDNNRGAARGAGSYYFSRYTSIWGWATWRRAWQSYDVDLHAWPALKASGGHRALFASTEEAEHFAAVWDEIRAGTLDTWDAQWLFCRLKAGSLSIAPNGNLVSNIGFRADATHTRDVSHPFAELPTRGLAFPLRHPVRIVPDDVADRRRVSAEFLRRPPLRQRLAGTLGNKHWYGQWLRNSPLIGPAWAGWRNRRKG